MQHCVCFQVYPFPDTVHVGMPRVRQAASTSVAAHSSTAGSAEEVTGNLVDRMVVLQI